MGGGGQEGYVTYPLCWYLLDMYTVQPCAGPDVRLLTARPAASAHHLGKAPGASRAWKVPRGHCMAQSPAVAPPPNIRRVLLPSPTLCPWEALPVQGCSPTTRPPPGAPAQAAPTGALSCCVSSTEAEGEARSPLIPESPEPGWAPTTHRSLSRSPFQRAGRGTRTLPLSLSLSPGPSDTLS